MACTINFFQNELKSLFTGHWHIERVKGRSVIARDINFHFTYLLTYLLFLSRRKVTDGQRWKMKAKMLLANNKIRFIIR